MTRVTHKSAVTVSRVRPGLQAVLWPAVRLGLLSMVCLSALGLLTWEDSPIVRAQWRWRHPFTQELANPDRAVARRAFHEIKTDLLVSGPPMQWLLERVWPMALMRGRHYNMAARMALYTIRMFPGNIGIVQQAMDLRVRALLQAHHPRQALSAAHALLNVCTMRMTEHAVLLVAQCLNAAFPDDPEVVQDFKNQQVAGAVAVSAGGAPHTCAVLESIAVRRKPFASTLRDLEPFTDYQSLLARGNLLLLMGKAPEAMTIFRVMANQYGADRTAKECMARALKAEDGTIGRANGWVLSLEKSGPGQVRR